jgi:gliding motility-associated-like protein
VQVLPTLSPLSISQSCNILQVQPNNYPLQWYLEDIPILGATQRELLLEQKGKYRITVFGPCDTLTSVIEAEPITPTHHDIPNVFTPNGDEDNPTFQLSTKLLGSRLSIYNRWGSEVYRTESYQNDWDGNGLSNGTYFYLLTVDCIAQPIRGIVELLR